MPANRRSSTLTNAYRSRLLSLSDRAQAVARSRWPSIGELDGTDWPEVMAATLSRAQTEGVRLTGGYLAAYARSEGATGRTPLIDSRSYAGRTRDGQPLAEALVSPLIGVRAALKEGRPPGEALNLGRVRALRTVGFEVVQTAREALIDAIAADERFEGFQRAVSGTCAACMALSGSGGPKFEVHPNCACVPQPTVKGAADRFPLPTGAALFSALSKPEQEKAIGAEAAQLVRDGDADLKDFVSHSPQAERDPLLTQRPTEAVAT